MPTISPKKTIKISSAENAAVISQVITDSQFYLGFVIHVTGYLAGLSCNIQGSLDGAAFGDLDDTTFNLATPHYTTGTGVIFQFELKAPIRGGLRFVSTGNNDSTAGVINVSMYKSAFSRGLTEHA